MNKIIFTALLFASAGVFAQTGIGTTTPNASARLDVSASDKGFLPPRVLLTASNAAGPIASPVAGLLVYNTAAAGTSPNNVVPGYYFWNGSAWVPFASSVGAISGTATANGASFTSGVLNLAPADASNGGVVTNGTQTFAGAKTFSGNLSGSNSTNPTISGFTAKVSSPTLSGSTYTLVASDNGLILNINSASAVTLYVPSGLPNGFNCMVVQYGDGQIALTQSGTTIYNRNSFTKTAGKYSIVTLLNIGSNLFIASGEMSN